MNNVIDVEAKVIEVIDFCEPKRPDTWRNRCFHSFVVIPCAVVGACTIALWCAGQAGIGYFVFYYGPTAIRAMARICGVES